MRFRSILKSAAAVFLAALTIPLTGCISDTDTGSGSTPKSDAAQLMDPQIEAAYAGVTEKYVDKSGVIATEKIADYVEELYASTDELAQKGIIKNREKGTTYVYVEDKNGIGSFLAAPNEEFAAGDNSLYFCSYQPFYSEFNSNASHATDLMNRVAKGYQQLSGFDSKQTILKDGQVTAESAKQWKPNSVILWDGHGYYSHFTGSCLALPQVIDGYSQAIQQELTKAHFTLVKLYNKRYVALTPKFFRDYYSEGDLDNTLIYLSTCESGKDIFVDDTPEVQLSNVLLDKGASAVFVNSDTVLTRYTHQMAHKSLIGIASGKTAGEALEDAKKAFGESDADGWKALFKSDDPAASVWIIGDENYSLSTAKKTASATDPTDPPTKPTTPPATTAPPVTTAPPASTAPPSPDYIDPNTYHNSEYGWTVQLSKEFQQYGITVEHGDNADSFVYGAVGFYYKEAYEADKNGLLFTIYATPIGSEIDNRTTGSNPNRGGYLGADKQYAFYWSGPTDLQVNEKSPDFERQLKEYQQLSEKNESTINSFVLLDSI